METGNYVNFRRRERQTDAKWTYKVKRDIDGNVCRFNERLVARGFSRIYGKDYYQVVAPVVKQTTFRILLSVAAKAEMHVEYIDVKNAFLKGGDLKEII